MENKKLESTTVEELQKLRERGDAFIYRFGQLCIEIELAQRALNSLFETKRLMISEEYDKLSEEQEVILESIAKEHGNIESIDIDNGTVTLT